MENTAPKFFCFVLMPFTSDFDDVYSIGIKESCNNAGAYCERVDEQIFQERILDRIYNQIAKADLVIADMTGKNPNVFYEVGYAHALNKPTILLTKNADDIPFDLKHFPHIIYGAKISTLRDELTKRVVWFKSNNDVSEKTYKTDIEIYVDDKNLSLENVTHEYPSLVPYFQFTIHNNSPFTYKEGSFQIGIISDEVHKAVRTSNVLTTRLPDRKYLHVLPFSEFLFPGGYSSFQFAFEQISRDRENENDFSIIIRVFTEAGSRDYPLQLNQRR